MTGPGADARPLDPPPSAEAIAWAIHRYGDIRAPQMAALYDEIAAYMRRWRPIETAPKDGTVIDLWLRLPGGQGTRITYCHWEDGAWRYGDIKISVPATHWQPLPAPPQEDEHG